MVLQKYPLIYRTQNKIYVTYILYLFGVVNYRGKFRKGGGIYIFTTVTDDILHCVTDMVFLIPLIS